MDAFAPLGDLARGLDQGDFSSVELTREHLGRIEARNPRLNAFNTISTEHALAQAAAADERIVAGTAGPLTGLPVAHKDIFCTDGIRTSCGSRMLDNWIAPYDATLVTRLNDAGMVTLGKTNMDEFAMGSSNENSYYGAALNPWDPTRVPGGSSGGSAAAVAAGLTPIATGTDTGGSIRQPAAFCGVCGLKPSYGRVSRYGMVAFASSLDAGGPIARDVADLARMMPVISGFDPRDSTSSEQPVDRLVALAAKLDGNRLDGNKAILPPGLTIGLPREYFDNLSGALAVCLDQARNSLEKQGARFVEVSLPHTASAIPTYYVIASAEASTNLSRYDGARFGHRCEHPANLDDLYQRSRSEGFGREVKRRILTGTYTLSVGYYDAYYVKAQRVRRLIRDDFLRVFEHVDLLLAPTAPNPAFPLDQLLADPIGMYQQDAFTVPASLAGIPALAIPCGLIEDLPVGLQLMGPHFSEVELLEAGMAFQADTDWHRRHPQDSR